MSSSDGHGGHSEHGAHHGEGDDELFPGSSSNPLVMAYDLGRKVILEDGGKGLIEGAVNVADESGVGAARDIAGSIAEFFPGGEAGGGHGGGGHGHGGGGHGH